MNSNLTMITVLVTVIHVIVLAIMIWIRVRRTPGDGIEVPAPEITPCALCGEPASDWSYDGLDPNEQLDSRTGKSGPPTWPLPAGVRGPLRLLCMPRESGS